MDDADPSADFTVSLEVREEHIAHGFPPGRDGSTDGN